ncbi:MAG: hypothetical protein M1832_001210 [Thelocarpon impressellum]|nr:MAG: hypothetical protein M1832_001210 [Thelocarpon impressellum]
MASVPSQSPAAQRRSSSSHDVADGSSAQASHDRDTLDQASSSPPEASLPILLNDMSSQKPTDEGSPQDQIPSASLQETEEPRKCWICFTDETEDTPLSSAWRSPCPCALTAHEGCLLDWIADLEAPDTRKRSNAGTKILCPQCKSEITVARPRSLVVDAVTAVEHAVGQLALPGICAVVGGCVWTGCYVYGINTVYLIFGHSDGDAIMGAPWGAGGGGFMMWHPLAVFSPQWSWRLGLGLPLIPPVLVLSRTRLADSVLPILPMLFLISRGGPHDRLDLTRWPPSPSVVLAVLPYLRGAYNELYDRTLGEWERKLIKEVQPRRAGDDGGGEGVMEHVLGQAHVGEVGGHADDVVIDVDVEIEILEEEEFVDGEHPIEPAAIHGPQPAVRQPEGQPGIPAVAPEPAVHAAEPPPPQRAGNLVISTGQLADTIIGALLFPTVSATMGALLRLVLPTSWTTPPLPWQRARGAKLGLLQARWGRNIVGGCLFIVLKDAVMLYARWKQAQGHRHRRVLDYDRKRGKAKAMR